MSHHCHATNCNTAVPPEMFMLPKPIRNEIWRTYRIGQCSDWRITHRYAEAARKAVIYIANKEGHMPDVFVYDMLDPERKPNG